MNDWVNLASYRRCTERILAKWPEFLKKREERLEQQRRMGVASEKVAENIIEDLFTTVLDWPLSDFNNQVHYADIVLTSQGIKKLIVETKYPGSLAWNRYAVERALCQAKSYADRQKVGAVAVSDGCMFYAANVQNGGLRDRVFISLSASESPFDLWWLSVDGIWRERAADEIAELRLLPEEPLNLHAGANRIGDVTSVVPELLHPKYKVPAACFAYVGDYNKPNTWKLPYLLANGTVDAKRLPKAVQSILSNYRGARVSGIPEQAIPAVLNRLAEAARHTGHMAPENPNPAPIYRQLEEALRQLAAVPDRQSKTNPNLISQPLEAISRMNLPMESDHSK